MKFELLLGAVAAASVTAQAPACPPGGAPFIKVKLVNNALNAGVSEQLATAVAVSLQDAAARWSKVITTQLSPVTPNTPFPLPQCGPGAALSQGETVDNLLIFARIDTLDGAGGATVSSGGCLFTNVGAKTFPRGGQMLLDSADMKRLAEGGMLLSAMMHEIGHVLGIGSAAWQKQFVPAAGAANPLYGPASTAAVKSFIAAGGSGAGLPVEDLGSGGARNAHWKEAALGDELMTSQLTGTSQPLSAITIAALQDLGYTVDASKADAFQVPAPAATPPANLATPPAPPNCRNIDFAPKPGAGTQFVTGACKVDNDCASGCCEFTKNVCRNALALDFKGKKEACKNGFSPVFDGAPCSSAQVPPPLSQPTPPSTTPTVPPPKPPAPGSCRNIDQAPKAGTGSQFVTGPCKVDNDCASGCCEFTKNVCRNALALFPSKGEACKNGFSPVFDGPPCAGRRLEAEPAHAHVHAHAALRTLQDATEQVPTAADSGWENVNHPDTSVTATFLGPDGPYSVDMRALNGALNGAPETSGAGAGAIAGAAFGSSLATLAVVALVAHYRRKSGSQVEVQAHGVVPNPGYAGKY
jgi:hypothetical protein